MVTNTVINNTYSVSCLGNTMYANRQVPGAVTAVPRTAFAQSQAVGKASVPVARGVVASAPVAAAAPIAPAERSVRGGGDRGQAPPARAFERPVIARNAPPAPHVGLVAQQPQLAATPGKPLDEPARRALRPAPDAPAPVVKVIAPSAAAAAAPLAAPTAPKAVAARAEAPAAMPLQPPATGRPNNGNRPHG